jgi:hypothetical protein
MTKMLPDFQTVKISSDRFPRRGGTMRKPGQGISEQQQITAEHLKKAAVRKTT